MNIIAIGVIRSPSVPHPLPPFYLWEEHNKTAPAAGREVMLSYRINNVRRRRSVCMRTTQNITIWLLPPVQSTHPPRLLRIE